MWKRKISNMTETVCFWGVLCTPQAFFLTIMWSSESHMSNSRSRSGSRSSQIVFFCFLRLFSSNSDQNEKLLLTFDLWLVTFDLWPFGLENWPWMVTFDLKPMTLGMIYFLSFITTFCSRSQDIISEHF